MKFIILLSISIFYIELNAQIVNIPDPIFKGLLLSGNITTDIDGNLLMIDTNDDNEIQVSEAQAVYQMHIWPNPGNSISDLTGIGAFSNLQTLMIKGHAITSLDMTSNLNLRSLESYSNPVSSINISTNVLLWRLWCELNQFTEIDVSNNVALLEITLYGSQIANLDVSNNVNLQSLHVDLNQLTSLDVTQNVKLKSLSFGHNMLTEIDVTHNPELGILYCFDNFLTDIDISTNPEVTTFICNNNPLESLNIKNGSQLLINEFSGIPNLQYICADGFEYPQVQNMIFWYGYTGVVVNGECNTLGTTDLISDDFAIYPNPAETEVKITNLEPGSYILISDIFGKTVYEHYYQQGDLSINIADFRQGVYLVTVESSKGISYCQKLIVGKYLSTN